MGNSIKKASNMNEFKTEVYNTNNKINSKNFLKKETNIYITLTIDVPETEIVTETILWKFLVKVLILVYNKTNEGNYKNEQPFIKTKLSFGEFYKFLESIHNYIDLENKRLSNSNNNSSSNNNTTTSASSATTALNALYSSQDNGDDDKLCPICLDNEATSIGDCAHAFCTFCIKEWREKSNSCPLCRSENTSNDKSDFLLIEERSDDNNDSLLEFIKSTLYFIKK
ncbi:hypothetical protein DICPUDRAFT_26932 [Dictyostelium purpureum]|uniref:RING-type domain-containing protein n=1 Tax=Dictyostelium purpureum TaxID=5786 RepID=F0Z9F1_DICPU|nr:uncharacterized protein DICPUDRAFT_26932 [Dictyostelium purpureum]EGC39371.1 hypothetical protein DICPUDRAFT_26932 [Dictyostelium purpureum]|eukprot:XP_003284045.1 hypothetical protein DICPUDRAFT_26932 [Dictyostelium purpureum]